MTCPWFWHKHTKILVVIIHCVVMYRGCARSMWNSWKPRNKSCVPNTHFFTYGNFGEFSYCTICGLWYCNIYHIKMNPWHMGISSFTACAKWHILLLHDYLVLAKTVRPTSQFIAWNVAYSVYTYIFLNHTQHI